MNSTKSRRRYVGNVYGTAAKLGRDPFFEIQLGLEKIEALDRLLARANGNLRCTLALTLSFHQLDRLRVTETDPPDYELRASAEYMRGDTMRVSGKEGRSCNIDLSARFGVPEFRKQLRQARERASRYVVLRVPNSKHDLLEIIPDSELATADEQSLLSASANSTASLLPAEDFSDWEKQ